MKKKVMFLNSSLGSGGAERQMVMLINLINERDYTPHVLTYCNISDDYPFSAKMIRHNVSTSNKILRNISLIWTLLKIHPEVLLSYTGDPNMLACIYKLMCPKCRVVVSERNIMEVPMSRRTKIQYYLYRKVDLIVSNSEEQLHRMISTYPQYGDKITVIKNFTEVPSLDSVIFKSSANPIIICVLARYHPQKNLLGFIKALSVVISKPSCPAFICRFYGRNTQNGQVSQYYRECENLVRELELNNVELYGYSDHTKELMQESDVVCLPSYKEGFSNSLSEAVCLGRPILASDVSDNHFFVDVGENGYLFNPHSIDDMAENVYRILSENSKYCDFGKHSYLLASKLFDKSTFIESYLKALDI